MICLQKEIVVGAFAKCGIWTLRQAGPLLLRTLQRWRLKLLRPEKEVNNFMSVAKMLKGKLL